MQKPKYILTDIEGTTTSISFVTETLFPYFLENLDDIIQFLDKPEVIQAFEETIRLALELDNQTIATNDEILAKLKEWCEADRKITPLKTLQGVLWDVGYKNGSLKGHVYPEVAAKLKEWYNDGIGLAVFSSGSVAAQKLIFGYSEAGDLTPFFSAYFDTTTGGKREHETYPKIAAALQVNPNAILFLSDIVEELEAAKEAGCQTIQLLRPGTNPAWDVTAKNFDEITFNN